MSILFLVFCMIIFCIMSSTTSFRGCIAVHLGAGNHSMSKAAEYKSLCKQACVQANKLLNEGATSLEAVTMATSILENSPLTNAGYGSNLTKIGTIECDASVMDGCSKLYGSVGGIKNIKNPVQVAKCIIDEQKSSNLPLGLIPPCCLVGDGASNWAVEHGFTEVSNQDMISDKAKKLFKIYQNRLQNNTTVAKRPRIVIEDDQVNDTVGAVCIDNYGNVSSTVSSGGIALKNPGRVGQAFMYGSGCWAENSEKECPAIGISTSGCGEYITKTLLASNVAQHVFNNSNVELIEGIHDYLMTNYIQSKYLPATGDKMVGMLMLVGELDDNLLNLVWAHSTASMCLAYMFTDDIFQTIMSRLPVDKIPGQVVISAGIREKLLSSPFSK